MRTPYNSSPFLQGYLACALWSSADDDGEPLDNTYTVGDLADITMKEAQDDCGDFLRDHAGDLQGIDPAQAGHGFWLTRNRHGAGFWDRGLGDVGDRLSAAAHAAGELGLYVGDDGKLYFS